MQLQVQQVHVLLLTVTVLKNKKIHLVQVWDYESAMWTIDGKYPVFLCYQNEYGQGPTGGAHHEIDFTINADQENIERMWLWCWSLSSGDAKDAVGNANTAMEYGMPDRRKVRAYCYAPKVFEQLKDKEGSEREGREMCFQKMPNPDPENFFISTKQQDYEERVAGMSEAERQMRVHDNRVSLKVPTNIM